MKKYKLSKFGFSGILIMGILTIFGLTNSFFAIKNVQSTNIARADSQDINVDYYSKNFASDSTITEWEDVSNLEVGTVDTWKGFKLVDNSVTAQGGYAVFKVNVKNNGKVLSALSVNFSESRFAYYFGDYGNKIEVSVSEDGDDYASAWSLEGSSNSVSEFSANLTNSIAGKALATCYIKIWIGPSTAGCGFDCGWIVLQNIKISGTESENQGPSETHTYDVKDYWGGEGTQGTSIPNSKIWNATTVNNLGGDGNPDWGAVVGTWGGTVSVEDNTAAEIIYKIGFSGQVITNATFKGEFKFWNANSDVLHSGDRIFVDASIDGESYERIEHVSHLEGADITKTYNSTSAMILETSLNSYIESVGRQQFIFVKITMMHYLAHSAELGNWGMFIHDSGVHYETKNALIINYDVDGGNLAADTKKAFYKDDSVYTLPTPTRQGYSFEGWFDGQNQITTFDPKDGKNLNVKAKWEILATSHVITYNNTKGAKNDNPLVYDELSSDIIILQPLSVIGYDFLGWFDAEEGGNKVEQINPQAQSIDIVLYAHWAECEYDLIISLDDHSVLTLEGHDTLPEKIKFTETFLFNMSFTDGYELRKVIINDKLLPETKLVDGTSFEIKGSDCETKYISVTSVKAGLVSKNSIDCNFSQGKNGDNSWKENVFDYSNLRMISDNPNSTGLSIVSEGLGVLVFKFDDIDEVTYTDIAISGSARLFDFNAGQYVVTNLRISISEDGENYTLLKQYSAVNLTDGDEMVNLATTKVFKDAMAQVYVKAELSGSAGMDWAVIKSLSIELGTENVLDEVKEKAKKEIETYAADVVESAKEDVKKVVDAAKELIDEAENTETITTIVENAKNAIAEINLQALKIEAKAEIDNYVKDWDQELLNNVTSIITKAKNDIDSAEDDVTVAFVLSDAKSNLDQAKKQYDDSKELEAARTKALKELDEYEASIDLSKYDEENQKNIKALIESARTTIKTTSTISDFSKVISSLKESISKLSKKSGGCGSSIIVTSALTSLIAVIGVALICTKKKED